VQRNTNNNGKADSKVLTSLFLRFPSGEWCLMMIELRDARPIARMLAGLSDPSRLMIALCLLQRPHYVGELSAILRIPVVNVSHHLGVLKQAGLVEDSREGRRVLYRLREEVLDAASGPNPQTVLNLGPYRLWITEPPPVQPMEWPRGRRRGRPRRHKRPPESPRKRSSGG